MRKLAASVLLLMFGMVSVAFGQGKTITGTVTSATDNQPLPGATVMVKGTTVGTVTDLDGKYVLVVPQDKDVLVFTFLGFKTLEESIGSKNVVNIAMDEDVLGLETVVVTALGIPKEKLSLGVSTQEVGGDRLASSGEENLVEALSAKAAGIQVVGSAGTPGASAKIIIRGPSTFTNENQPLIVIDGVPIDNSTTSTVAGDYPFNPTLNGVSNSNRAIDINPDDVESINILKGPAAAALYGSRAGSGAIIITTKRGNKAGDKAVHINFSSSLEVSQVNKIPAQQQLYAQGSGGGFTDADGNVDPEGNYITSDPGPDFLWGTDDDGSAGTANSWGPLMSNIGITPTDNPGEFFQNGMTYNNNLSVSGGTDRGSLRLSIGNTQDKGIVPNTEFDRTSVRVNSDMRIYDKLKVAVDANYITSGGTRAQNGSNLSGVMLSLLRTPTSYDLGAGYEYPSGDNRNYFSAYDNPYWTVNNNPYTDNVNRLLSNVSATYTPWTWLNVTYRVGADNYTDLRKQIFSIGSNDPANAPGGQIEENTIRYRQIYSDLIATATHQVNEDLGITLTVGNNLTDIDINNQYSRGRDLTIPDFYNLSNAADLYSSQYTTKQRNAAFFGDLEFDYRELLFLTLTGRDEFSSTYGPNQSSAFFPSASVAFVFSDILTTNNIWSFGKLRFAYAQAGIEPQPYSADTYFIPPLYTDGFTDGYSFPYLGQSGFGYSQLNTLGNPDLSPERLTGTEFGLELKFWKGRIDLDAVYYIQESSDILLTKPIASTSGFSYVYDNAGAMTNKGIELTLNADIIKKKNLTWNVGGNFSKNENEVTQLADGVDEIEIEAGFGDPGAYVIVGQPYGLLYGSQWAYNEDGDLLIDPSSGLPIFDTVSGVIGDPYPDWLMNISTALTYKGFTVSGLLDIRKGGDIWCGTIARMNRIGISEASGDRTETYVIDGVIENADGTYSQNDIAISPADYWQSYQGDFGASSQAVYDGGWVRLREVKLAYEFNLDKKNVIKGLTVAATGRNLFLKTDYPGVDPETSLTGAGSNISGFDWFNNPGTKSYLFTVSAAF
ncbi:MAG: SusC/RagA family TonB-linked outer membrane protein [Chitinophagales bacterium]|nr:SusC/RagA family TonB-linked outer membrane protein [Chitinophagales bacterium]